MDSTSAGIGALVLEVWTCVLSLTQLKTFNGCWCSVIIRSWRRYGCAFCPHEILSSGLLCSALCLVRRVLCTSWPPRLHRHVLQHCECVSFVLVFAWLLMFSRPSEGGVMSQFAQEIFRQHLQSSVRTALLELSSDSRTIVFLAEHAT